MKVKEAKEKKTRREKIEERREEVLAKGRKYKYPMQFAKHKIVLITILVSTLALVTMVVLGYLALYKFQSTDDLIYRITQVLPVGVAKVDDERVRYSDYLLIYRSTVSPVERQQGQFGNDTDAEAMREYYKRQALTDVEDYAYANKLAKEMKIKVTEQEITDAVNAHRMAGGVERSEESFRRILQDNFGLSMNEYRRMVELALIKQKVSENIDEAARAVANEVQAKIAAGKDLKEIAEELGQKVLYEETGGMVDLMNIDGGRAAKALKLEVGQISERFLSSSGDGYYYVKLVEKDETQVSYESIEIPFTEFDERVAKLREEGKIEEWIKVDDQENE